MYIMQKLLLLLPLVFAISLVNFLLTHTTFAKSSRDYPKTLDERKAEEIGSVAGPAGITFSPKILKNTTTKASLKSNIAINLYLWQASIDVLSFVPLSSVDSNSGIIITEWYQTPEGHHCKLQVIIKSNTITPEAIEVIAFERDCKKDDQSTSKQVVNSILANSIENKILRKARDLYLKSEHILD